MSYSDSEWLERFRFSHPVGQCGTAIYFLAGDRSDGKQVVIKQYIASPNIDDAIIDGLYQDEVRLFKTLQKKGIVETFDNYISPDGKRFVVVDLTTASELMCGHLHLKEQELTP